MLHSESLGVHQWHPERAKRFFAAWATNASDEPSVELLADFDDPNDATVYIYLVR